MSMQNEATNGVIRYAQVRDESNHKHCSEGNQKALLTERLNSLRVLLKDIKESDWMFEGKGSDKRDKDAPQPLGRGVERHF